MMLPNFAIQCWRRASKRLRLLRLSEWFSNTSFNKSNAASNFSQEMWALTKQKITSRLPLSMSRLFCASVAARVKFSEHQSSQMPFHNAVSLRDWQALEKAKSANIPVKTWHCPTLSSHEMETYEQCASFPLRACKRNADRSHIPPRRCICGVQ